MHICQWIHAPIPGFRGDSVDILRRSLYLVKKGIDVDILSDSGTQDLPLIIRSNRKSKFRIWKLGRIGEEMSLFKIQDHQNIELLHSYPHMWTEGGILTAKIKNIPIISELLDNPIIAEKLAIKNIPKSDLKISCYAQKWLDFILENSSYVIVLSKTYKKYLTRTFPDFKHKFRLLPQVGLVKFNHPPPKKPNRIVFVGSYMGWHGWEVLVRAIPYIRKVFPGAFFTFIGINFEQAMSFLEKAQQKIIKKEVNFKKSLFLSKIPADEYSRILSESQIGIASHISHGRILGCSPMKVFDYLRHGTVVVASDIPELIEINPKKDIISYFHEGNPLDLAEEVIKLLSNEEVLLQRSHLSLRLVADKFNFHQKMRSLISLYYDVIEQNEPKDNSLSLRGFIDYSALRILFYYHGIKKKIKMSLI